jgi:hypothetical protein
MRVSLPFWGRFLAVGAIFFTWLICMICNVFDGMINNALFLFLIGSLVLAILCAGISKGMLPTKKVVKQSVDAWKEGKHHQAIIDFGVWICLWIALFGLCIIGYTAEM